MKFDTIRSGGQSQGGLDESGGTLSGPLMLSRNPQLPLEAATKAYVDAGIQALNASNFTSGTLPIARLPALTGDVTSEAGSNIIDLSNSGITVGEYGKVVVNEKGRVTNGTSLAGSDIPNIGFDKITSDKPSTLEGYGIIDAVPSTGILMTGALNLSGNPTNNEHLVSKQYIDGMVNNLSSAKTGDVVRKSYSTTPTGFLKCNGAEVSKTTYADLYAIIGESNSSYNAIGSGKPWQYQYEFNKSQSVDVGNWTTGTSLPAVLHAAMAFVTKNRVYICGGHNASSTISSVYTAPINIDGTLGAWTTSTSLPVSLYVAQAVVTKNRVHIIGGATNVSTASSIVYTAVINVDGTIGAWSTGTSLPSPLGWSQSIVTNSRVYILGGYTGTVLVSTIYSAPVNSDGTLGTWVIDGTIPTAMNASSVIVTKNRVYLLGGNAGVGNAIASVYTAIINSDGTLGTWTTGTSLPGIMSASSVVVTNNRVYLLGAYTGATISTVYTAPINEDGTLGTWTTGPSLPGTLAWSHVINTKSRIYLLGGTSASVVVSTVYTAGFSGGLNDYSPYYEDLVTNYLMPGSGRPWEQQYELNSTQSGNITGWSAGTALPISVHGHQILVTKNRVYLIGGGSGGTGISSVYTATINSDGTLGTWASTTSLPGILSSSSLIVTKNRVYLIGGYTSAAVSTVYTAPINADGTLGTWTTGTSLPTAVYALSSIVTKNRVYTIAGYGTNVVYTAPINSDGTLGAWATGTALPTALHGCSICVTKNRLYVIGGGTVSTAQSTVYTASINSDGLLGTWTTTTSLPGNLYNAYTFVVKNCIYLIAGSATNSSTTLSSVYKSNINIDGTLGPWSVGASLPIGLCAGTTIATKNHIFTIGGYNGASSVANVYVATISEGLNDYSAYYDGSILPLEPVNPTSLFKLPDMSATDVNGIYHYIKH